VPESLATDTDLHHSSPVASADAEVPAVDHDSSALPGMAGVTPLTLFLVFAEISLSSFGGAIAWARRILVERRGWLSDREFAELLGLCQAIPGPSLVNLSIHLGTRQCGALGAAAAASGLILSPLVVLLPLAVVYAQGADLGIVRDALRGVAAAAAGVLVATGLRLTWNYRRRPLALGIAALAFLAVGGLHWPLLAVLAVLAPPSIALAWRHAL
jgi:chromate transporter